MWLKNLKSCFILIIFTLLVLCPFSCYASEATSGDTIEVPRSTIVNWRNSLESTREKLILQRQELETLRKQIADLKQQTEISKNLLKQQNELYLKQAQLLNELQVTQTKLLEQSTELLSKCDKLKRQSRHRKHQRNFAYAALAVALIL